MSIKIDKTISSLVKYDDKNGNGKIDDGETVATISFSSSNGKKFDKFKVTGDASVFTIEEIQGDIATRAYESTSTDSLATDKDGKIKIEADKEYNLGSLVKSFGQNCHASVPSTVTTPTVDLPSNANITAMNAIGNIYSSRISSALLCASAGGLGATMAYSNLLNQFTNTMLEYINGVQQATTPANTASTESVTTSTPAFVLDGNKAPEAPAVEKEAGRELSLAHVAAVTVDKTSVAKGTSPSVDNTAAKEAAEEQAWLRIMGKANKLGLVPYKNVNGASETLKNFQARVELAEKEAQKQTEAAKAADVAKYENCSAVEAKEAELAKLQAKLDKTTASGPDYPKLLHDIGRLKYEIDEIKNGNTAKAKEAKIDSLVLKINKSIDNYNKAIKINDTTAQQGYKTLIISSKKDLMAFVEELKSFGMDYSKEKLDEFNKNLKATGISEEETPAPAVAVSPAVTKPVISSEKTAISAKEGQIKSLIILNDSKLSPVQKETLKTLIAELDKLEQPGQRSQELKDLLASIDKPAAKLVTVAKPPITDATRKLLEETYSVQLKELGIKLENIKSEKVGQEALAQAKAQAVKDGAKSVTVAKPPITDATKKLLKETYSEQMKELGYKLEDIISEKVGQEALAAVKIRAAKDAAKANPKQVPVVTIPTSTTPAVAPAAEVPTPKAATPAVMAPAPIPAVNSQEETDDLVQKAKQAAALRTKTGTGTNANDTAGFDDILKQAVNK